MTAMTLIESKTLGTAAASIEFTSIPQDATDLLVVTSLRFSIDLTDVSLRLNGSDSSYSMILLYGTGSAAASAANSSGYFVWSGNANFLTSTASTFGNSQLYFPNYSGATNKSVSIEGVSENNDTTSYQTLTAGLWANTAAITSLTFSGGGAGGNFVAGSTISLYKITKGSDGIVTTSP
jgi:hypothetical protein